MDDTARPSGAKTADSASTILVKNRSTRRAVCGSVRESCTAPGAIRGTLVIAAARPCRGARCHVMRSRSAVSADPGPPSRSRIVAPQSRGLRVCEVGRGRDITPARMTCLHPGSGTGGKDPGRSGTPGDRLRRIAPHPPTGPRAPAYPVSPTRRDTLSVAQGLATWLARGTGLHGWALAMQGQGAQGIADIRQGLAADLAPGAQTWQPYGLGRLAEAYGEGGHPEEGLRVLAEALAVVDTTAKPCDAAELSRLKGRWPDWRCRGSTCAVVSSPQSPQSWATSCRNVGVPPAIGIDQIPASVCPLPDWAARKTTLSPLVAG